MGPSGDFMDAVFHAYVTSTVPHVQNLPKSLIIGRRKCQSVKKPVRLQVTNDQLHTLERRAKQRARGRAREMGPGSAGLDAGRWAQIIVC